jgi:hypothetical protein
VRDANGTVKATLDLKEEGIKFSICKVEECRTNARATTTAKTNAIKTRRAKRSRNNRKMIDLNFDFKGY